MVTQFQKAQGSVLSWYILFVSTAVQRSLLWFYSRFVFLWWFIFPAGQQRGMIPSEISVFLCRAEGV